MNINLSNTFAKKNPESNCSKDKTINCNKSHLITYSKFHIMSVVPKSEESVETDTRINDSSDFSFNLIPDHEDNE